MTKAKKETNIHSLPARSGLRIYKDSDIDLNLIRGKKVAVIGYGNQGHAHALNLRDSGVKDTRIALRKDSPSAVHAKNANFDVIELTAAAQWADVVMVLTPDELQADIYREHLAPHMKHGAALAFAHGFNVHFNLIEPRADLDVFLAAPKGPGHGVRAAYTAGGGLPCLIAVHQNATGKAFDLALSYAGAIGAGRAGILETTFKEECETDLFGEQAVLCGGIPAIIEAGYDTLVEAGYTPEMAYFECIHETKLIVDLLYEGGLAHMRRAISNTAEYGGYQTGARLINDDVKAEMKKVLEEIQNGTFARNWMLENKAGQPAFKAQRRKMAEHPAEEVGEKLRAAMPSMVQNRLVKKA